MRGENTESEEEEEEELSDIGWGLLLGIGWRFFFGKKPKKTALDED